MGLFDRFRRPKQNGDSAPEDDGQPESMFEKVGDPQIEGGVPDVQSASGTSKSPQQLMLLGAAVVGCGLAIAGLMIWINSAPSEEETEEKEVPEISADSQYDMAADQARLLAEQQQEADASAPEGVEPEEEENPPASAPEGVTAEGQPETRTAEASAPELPPKDRRLTGEVLVATDGGTTSSMQSDAFAVGSAGNTAAIGANDPYMSDNPPAEGEQAQSVGLAGRLNPTLTASVQASRRASSDYLLAKGTNIPCTMQTKIVTIQPAASSRKTFIPPTAKCCCSNAAAKLPANRHPPCCRDRRAYSCCGTKPKRPMACVLRWPAQPPANLAKPVSAHG